MWQESSNILEVDGASALKVRDGGRVLLQTLVFFGRLHGVTSQKATSIWKPQTTHDLCLQKVT
jgi:hypothetical protein